MSNKWMKFQAHKLAGELCLSDEALGKSMRLFLVGCISHTKGIHSLADEMILQYDEDHEKFSKAGKKSAEKRQISKGVEASLQHGSNLPSTDKIRLDKIRLDKSIDKKKEREERKVAFATLAQQKFLSTYPKEELKKFVDYWTEHGDNDRKMRFEKQTSFSIERRLVTWIDRAEKGRPSYFNRDAPVKHSFNDPSRWPSEPFLRSQALKRAWNTAKLDKMVEQIGNFKYKYASTEEFLDEFGRWYDTNKKERQ